MRDKALELIQRLPVGAVVLSWRDAYPMVETSATVMVNATRPGSDPKTPASGRVLSTERSDPAGFIAQDAEFGATGRRPKSGMPLDVQVVPEPWGVSRYPSVCE